MNNVKIKRDGTIMLDGKPFGHVMRTKSPWTAGSFYRAECGDPAKPETYHVAYRERRRDAIADILPGGKS